MKKLLPIFLLFIAAKSNAQPEGRVFTIYTSPYANLTSPTVITTQGWDDFDAVVPLGFNFNLMGRTNDTLFFDSNMNEGADCALMQPSLGVTNGMTFGVDILDRSTIAGKPASTVGYRTDVVSGKKITKIEWKDVGFFGEQSVSSTLNDSANFQLWVYEGSDNVEVHWGPSKILSDYLDLYDFGLPFFGFVKNIDISGPVPTLDWMYYASATAPTPTVDSIDINGLNNLSGAIGINAYPTSGTVFKFAKPTTGVNDVQLNDYTKVYPTVITSECTVELSKENFNGTITIFDMNGRIVSTQKATTGKNHVDMNALAGGTYVLNIRNAEESVFYKIIK